MDIMPLSFRGSLAALIFGKDRRGGGEERLEKREKLNSQKYLLGMPINSREGDSILVLRSTVRRYKERDVSN